MVEQFVCNDSLVVAIDHLPFCLMQEVTVDGHKSYFDTRTDEHPHFYWEDEGALTDAPAADLKFAKLPSAPEGAEIAGGHPGFHGRQGRHP